MDKLTQPLYLPPAIKYESYLLRLRRVTVDGHETRQVYVQDIRSKEEAYFNSLDEAAAFLRARGLLRQAPDLRLR